MRDGRARGNADRTPSAVEKAADELRALLGSADPAPEQIKARLDTLRQVRAAARKNLAGACEELRKVLTVKQEASLVLMGFLE